MATKTAATATDEIQVPKRYTEVGLKKQFAQMIEVRQKLKRRLAEIEAELGDQDNPGLNQQIELAMAERDLKSVLVDNYVVIASEGKNVSIKRETLQQAMLEYGIEADDVNLLIETATVTKSYTYIQVQDAKKLLARVAKREEVKEKIGGRKLHVVKGKGGKR